MSSSPTWLQVQKNSHNATGYWGEPTTNHVFCEPHYAVTDYISEFYNCVSSLVYTVLAIYTIRNEPKLRRDPYILCNFIWLATIGIGSFFFHGTMRYSMQLTDEVPMMGFLTCLICTKLSNPKAHPWVPSQLLSRLWCMATVLLSVSVVYAYVVYDIYEIFVNGFIGITILDTIVSLPFAGHKLGTDLHHSFGFMSLYCILAGGLTWITENNLCKQFPAVYPLHVLWHCLSCASGYYAILFTCLFRFSPEEVRNMNLLGLRRKPSGIKSA